MGTWGDGHMYGDMGTWGCGYGDMGIWGTHGAQGTCDKDIVGMGDTGRRYGGHGHGTWIYGGYGCMGTWAWGHGVSMGWAWGHRGCRYGGCGYGGHGHRGHGIRDEYDMNMGGTGDIDIGDAGTGDVDVGDMGTQAGDMGDTGDTIQGLGDVVWGHRWARGGCPRGTHTWGTWGSHGGCGHGMRRGDTQGTRPHGTRGQGDMGLWGSPGALPTASQTHPHPARIPPPVPAVSPRPRHSEGTQRGPCPPSHPPQGQ